jgi:arylsulfatase A-like enzyme
VLAFAGSLLVAALAGALCLATSIVVGRARTHSTDPMDPSRRRVLTGVLSVVGLAFVAGGSALGATLRRVVRPDPRPAIEAMAHSLGSEYLELIVRGYHPERSGDLQLVVTPYSTSNYRQESLALLPNDPRSSHAVVWMYGERVPIVVWSPGLVEPRDHDERVTLADLAPTAARLMGFDDFEAPDGLPLPGIGSPATPPKVVVTFVIDGGGWNVLRTWPGAWPQMKRLMQGGATYRNAIAGSFPAVTASTHATIGTGAFPGTHGITGHNVRRGGEPMKAWGAPGVVDPSFLLVPTLADRWTEHTANAGWVGEIGYQVWHVGMLGRGGRPMGDVPVGVYWDQDAGGWRPHHPDRYRLPRRVPPAGRLDELCAAYEPPAPSPYDRWARGRAAMCCFPPIVRYQAELIEATFDSEPIGRDDVTDLLYVNYKAPDYSGHVYNMEDPRQAEVLAAVDRELGGLADMLMERFGEGGFALLVTADHGQCPQIDAHGGVRIDPIQLEEDLKREFGKSVFGLVQAVVPSEIYLNHTALADAGCSAEDIAAFLGDYRYGENLGRYVRPTAIRRDRLRAKSFAAVLPTGFIAELGGRDLGGYGATSYPEADPEGMPGVTW